MIKPEWGAKRQCPKCNTRFYDLGKEDPVTCINCGNQWVPEPILKSKQPLPFDAPKADGEKTEADSETLDDADLIEDDAEEPVDDADDIGGDDELADVVDPDTEEER